VRVLGLVLGPVLLLLLLVGQSGSWARVREGEGGASIFRRQRQSGGMTNAGREDRRDVCWSSTREGGHQSDSCAGASGRVRLAVERRAG